MTTTAENLSTAPGVVFAGIGALVVCLSIAELVATVAFVGSAERAGAVVLGGEDGPFHTEVEFTASDGRRIGFRQNGLAAHDVGDQVDVLYAPEDPDDTACVDHPLDLYGWQIGGIAFGCAFMGVGASQILRSRLRIARGGASTSLGRP